MNSQSVLHTATTSITRILHEGLRIPVRMGSSHANKILNMQNLNPNFLIVEYAVRGPMVICAVELEKKLAKIWSLFCNSKKDDLLILLENYDKRCHFLQRVRKPFKNVIKANIRDALATEQKPITFFREVHLS